MKAPAKCKNLPKGCTLVLPTAIKKYELYYFKELHIEEWAAEQFLKYPYRLHFASLEPTENTIHNQIIMKCKGIYHIGMYEIKDHLACGDGTVIGEFYKLPPKYKYEWKEITHNGSHTAYHDYYTYHIEWK